MQPNRFGTPARLQIMIRWLHEQRDHLYRVSLTEAKATARLMKKKQFAEEFVSPAPNNIKSLSSLLSQEIQDRWYCMWTIKHYEAYCGRETIEQCYFFSYSWIPKSVLFYFSICEASICPWLFIELFIYLVI